MDVLSLCYAHMILIRLIPFFYRYTALGITTLGNGNECILEKDCVSIIPNAAFFCSRRVRRHVDREAAQRVNPESKCRDKDVKQGTNKFRIFGGL